MNLESIVAERLIYWSEQIAKQVNSKWTSTGIEGKKEITTEVHVTPLAVIATIIASGDSAFILEFGSGHLMDMSNPYLQEYMSGDRWNPARTADGNEFIGRAKGYIVHRPDGTTYESSGKAEGMRLEHALGKLPAFQAVEPMHIIKTEIEFTWPLIVADIKQSVATAITMEIMNYTR